MNAAIYSRKSKFTGKGESTANQIQLCREYISNHLGDRGITDIYIYEDEGFSGGNTNRPEFQRLLDDAKLKKFDVLVCYRLDRISRNVADFSNTLEILQKYGIEFISIREQFDTTSPMGRAMIYIASVFAQLERETIAERIRDNMLELAKTGRWLGGTAPLGYDSEPVTYFDGDMNQRKMVKLKQVPEELKIVKLIYEKYLEFKSLSKVETFLLQAKYKTKRGTDFDKVKLRIILTNPVYVKATQEVLDYLENLGITTCGIPDGEHGLLSYNKSKGIITEHGKTARVSREISEWIAAVSSQKGIIDAADWLEVQRILTVNRNKVPNLGKTHNALLTGILKCAKCGSTMQVAHGHTSKKTGKKIYYYTCSMKKFSRGVRCSSRNAKVSELDSVVINQLKKLIINKKELLNSIIEQNKKYTQIYSTLSMEESIKNSIVEKEKQIDNLLNKLSIDSDTADLIISKIKKIKNEIDELKNKLNKINSMKSEFKETGNNPSVIETLLKKRSILDILSMDELKQLIEALITKITWNSDDYSVEIHFIGSEPDRNIAAW